MDTPNGHDTPKATPQRRVFGDSELRATYLLAASVNPIIIGDRFGSMLPAYVADVATAASTAPLPPPHRPLSVQLEGRADLPQELHLRVAQWNLNVLHGHDFKSPVSAEAVIDVLSALNADILFLQEASPQNFEAPGPGAPPTPFDGLDSHSRIMELHARLRAAGYDLIIADGCANPALVATRLPITALAPAVTLDTEARFRTHMLGGPVPELRAVRVAVMSLGYIAGAPAVAVAATHLHHCEARAHGLRASEAHTLVTRLTDDTPASLRESVAALVATDFNSVRRRDYSALEWDVVVEGKERIGEFAFDGVERALAMGSLSCTYDHAGPGGATDAGAPTFTHWTSTVVDFCYFRPPRDGSWDWRVKATWPVYTALSDHLPIVHDFAVSRPSSSSLAATRRRMSDSESPA